VLLFSISVHAAKIEDIEVLDFMPDEPAEFQFKVRSKKMDPKSYFFLGFEKGKKEDLNKLSFLLLKMTRADQYKIDVDIHSFSPYPAGSYYSASAVTFSYKALRAPDQIKKPLKSKK
jgi:hypothetical protein